jgi:hypothetical protein
MINVIKNRIEDKDDKNYLILKGLKMAGEYFLTESILNETVHVSFHRKTPTEMAKTHGSVLKTNNHTVVNHETTGNGSHVMYHVTPSKKVRVSTISHVYDKKGYTSKIHDRPGTEEEQRKYGPKM